MTSNHRYQHERSHIVDSWFHGAGFSVPASKAIFGDTRRMQRWLDIEVALALSQADLGIIPLEAANEIKFAASLEKLDIHKIIQGIQTTGHSLVPLLRALQQACSPEAAEYVHFGATTQDIQDTGQALEMREVLDVIDVDLIAIINILKCLAAKHCHTVMVARTHSMPALPTSFGLKVAGWIDELLRHQERLLELRNRALVVQLFGGAGTMNALGSHAMELIQLFASRLQLSVPKNAWHVSRDRVAEFVSTLAMLLATLARIAEELRILNRAEIGEVSLGWKAHEQIGSSTMPHKRNPELNEQVVVLARLARNNASSALDAMIQEHERDYRGTRLEWCCVAEVSHYTLTGLDFTKRILDGLKVNDKRMAQNAFDVRAQIGSEQLVFALAAVIGKASAYRLIFEITQGKNREQLIEALVADETIMSIVGSVEALERLLDPASSLGKNSELLENVLAQVESVV